MRCEQVWDMLSAYADNEATGDEAAIVETHIAVCSECSADLQFMLSTSGSLGRVADVAPPATLHAAILAATVYRPTWQQQIRSAWASAFNFHTVRYAALAGSAAMAAWLAVRWNLEPATVNTVNRRPVAVTSAPPAPVTPAVVPDPSALFSPDLTPVFTPDASVHSAAPHVANAERPLRKSITRPRWTPLAPISSQPALARADRSARARRDEQPDVSPAGRSDVEAVEPAVDMLPAAPHTEMAEASTARGTEGAETTAAPAPPTVHVALASYSDSAPRTQLVTLADLKRSLRRQAMDDRSRFITESINEKRIRFDVVRSRF